MNGTDLTPQTYISRCRMQNAKQLWLIAVAACLLAGAVPIALEQFRVPDQTSLLTGERLAQAQTRLAQHQSQAAPVAVELKRLQRELQADQHLTQRPDWSVVIDQVARQFGPGLMMTGFRLGPPADNAVRIGLGELAPDAEGDSVWLILGGVSQANSDVPDLILRLEQLGLFDRVAMTGTWQETYAGGPRTMFVIACRVQ